VCSVPDGEDDDGDDAGCDEVQRLLQRLLLPVERTAGVGGEGGGASDVDSRLQRFAAASVSDAVCIVEVGGGGAVCEASELQTLAAEAAPEAAPEEAATTGSGGDGSGCDAASRLQKLNASESGGGGGGGGEALAIVRESASSPSWQRVPPPLHQGNSTMRSRGHGGGGGGGVEVSTQRSPPPSHQARCTRVPPSQRGGGRGGGGGGEDWMPARSVSSWPRSSSHPLRYAARWDGLGLGFG